MNKKLYLSLCGFFLAFTALEQTTSPEINGGNTSYSYRDYAPLNPYYGYNYTQMLYSASELTSAGLTSGSTITGLQFYYYTDAGDETLFDDWVIYLGNTTKSTFASTNSSEWVSTTSMTQVFNSTVSFSTAPNWITINFSSNIIWDGTSNLVIAIDENSPGWTANIDPWRSTDPSGSNDEVLQYLSDDINPDPSSPPTANYK